VKEGKAEIRNDSEHEVRLNVAGCVGMKNCPTLFSHFLNFSTSFHIICRVTSVLLTLRFLLLAKDCKLNVCCFVPLPI
jgi:hypothetical protein